MKTRIVVYKDGHGKELFRPQFRFGWIWWNYTGYGHRVEFRYLNEALEHIKLDEYSGLCRRRRRNNT